MNIIDIIQICDSTFPIGTFNHSYGMENYLRTNLVNNAEDFENWLKSFMESQFKFGDGLLIKLSLENLKKGNIDNLWELDRIITVSSQAIESREGNKKIAKQMLILIQELYSIKNIDIYLNKIKNKEVFGHPAIVFSILALEENLDIKEAINLYGYSINSTLIQNAVRAIPLGQMSGQVILKKSIETLKKISDEIIDLDSSYLGASIPGIEMAQINHEDQIFRLFMS